MGRSTVEHRLESWRRELETNECGWAHIAERIIEELEAMLPTPSTDKELEDGQ